MTDFVRTPESNFKDLPGFDFAPNYHTWQDLRIHFIDEGPHDAPVMLLLHGMPTWSFLYRDMIPLLVDAGYRCIAPDHAGFGRSDKPTDIHWYTIARHTEILTSLVNALDLNDITLLCQDWGGPTGLAQAALQPDRFARLCIMNTWLHHPEYVYSEAIQNWIKNWEEGGAFSRPTPNISLILPLSAGLMAPEDFFPCLVEGREPDLEGKAADMYAGFLAPFDGLPDEAYNGPRRFPLSIPHRNYENGNGAGQNAHYRALLAWQKPVHFIWGVEDDIFTEDWGRKWAKQMGASFDGIPGANHFLQNTHGSEVVDLLLSRIAEE
jgi:haloalkane dehalogenase